MVFKISRVLSPVRSTHVRDFMLLHRTSFTHLLPSSRFEAQGEPGAETSPKVLVCEGVNWY